MLNMLVQLNPMLLS